MPQQIGRFSLRNQGGFVTKLQFVYWDADGNKHHENGTGNILLGQTDSLDLSKYNLPDGTLVSLYAFVVWGTDNLANQIFTLRNGSDVTASYVITGTTLDNSLGLTGIGAVGKAVAEAAVS